MKKVIKHQDNKVKEIILSCSPAEYLIIRDALFDRLETNPNAADVPIIQGILGAGEEYERI